MSAYPVRLFTLAAASARISESGTASRKPTPAVIGAISFVLVAPAGSCSGVVPRQTERTELRSALRQEFISGTVRLTKPGKDGKRMTAVIT